MAHLEIKHLRMVQMITRTGNLTRAAVNLNITQSALSQQLKDIEEKLGTPLFFRTGKKMVLTRVGKNLLGRGEKIIEEMELAELEVAKAVNGEKGELKIGVRCMFCYKWLPDIITRFHEKYPNVDIEISNSMIAEQDLLAEKYDMVITALPEKDHQVSYIPLFQADLLCAMSTQHRLSKKKFLEIDDFQDMDIISLTEKSNNPFYQYFLVPNNIRPRRYMTIAQPEAIVELLGAGLGISVLPDWFIEPHIAEKNLHCCPLTARGITLQWKAALLKTEKPPAFQREFIQLIQKQSIPIVHAA